MLTPRIEELADGVTLYLGDCLEILPTLSGFDAVVMDPPYAIPTHVAAGRNNTRSVGDLSLIEATFRSVLESVRRSLRPGGRAFVFCDGASYPVMYRAAYSQFSSALLVWDKGRFGMGREFRKQHELILHLWQSDTPIFTDGVGRPDVLRFAPMGQDREHEAEKPVPLLDHLLTVCGDRICDPFMGGGSTGIAAIARGKGFVGIEIEPRFFDMACSRIDAAIKQPRMFAEPRAQREKPPQLELDATGSK